MWKLYTQIFLFYNDGTLDWSSKFSEIILDSLHITTEKIEGHESWMNGQNERPKSKHWQFLSILTYSNQTNLPNYGYMLKNMLHIPTNTSYTIWSTINPTYFGTVRVTTFGIFYLSNVVCTQLLKNQINSKHIVDYRCFIGYKSKIIMTKWWY